MHEFKHKSNLIMKISHDFVDRKNISDYFYENVTGNDTGTLKKIL